MQDLQAPIFAIYWIGPHFQNAFRDIDDAVLGYSSFRIHRNLRVVIVARRFIRVYPAAVAASRMRHLDDFSPNQFEAAVWWKDARVLDTLKFFNREEFLSYRLRDGLYF